MKDGWRENFLESAGWSLLRTERSGYVKIWHKTGFPELTQGRAIKAEQRANPCPRLRNCPDCGRIYTCLPAACTLGPKQDIPTARRKRNVYLKQRTDSGRCRQCSKPARPNKSLCQSCADKAGLGQARWVSENRNAVNQRLRRWARTHGLKQRKLVLAHYGNACNCCGEADHRFLTVDHINGDGARDPRIQTSGGTRLSGRTFYARIIRLGYPSDFQLLCWNCNHGKYIYGQCPHNLPQKGGE
jgi:hypothetical protein